MSPLKDRRSGFAHDNSRRSGNQDCLGQAGAIRMALQPSSLISGCLESESRKKKKSPEAQNDI
jgi:hypothetical protein